MKNRFVHYGAVLFIIAAVSAGILAVVNNLTKTVIENNETESGSIYDTVVSPFFCICGLSD